MSDTSTLVLAVAAGVISTIIVNKLVPSGPTGGGIPNQPNIPSRHTMRGGRLKVTVPARVPSNSAPIVQNTPITEAAYNTQPTAYAVTLGPDANSSGTEATLPI